MYLLGIFQGASVAENKKKYYKIFDDSIWQENMLHATAKLAS